MRKAEALIQEKELAYKRWCAHTETLESFLGESVVEGISYELWRHEVPSFTWEALSKALKNSGIDVNQFKAGWTD